MFYYGNCSDGHARDGVAFSGDLLNWQKGGEVLIDVGAPGSLIRVDKSIFMPYN